MTPAQADDRGRVQDVKWVLYWVYAGRMTVTLAVYGSALLVGDDWLAGGAWLPGMSVRTVSFITLGAVALITALSYSYSHFRSTAAPDQGFIQSQAVFDILLVTGIVHLTGGSESVFPPLLYIVLVSGYALITPLYSGVLIALATGFTYLFEIALAYPEQLGIAVVLQILIFTLVALLSGLIGGKLQEVGRQLSSMESELARLRVGTSDILRAIDAAVVTLDMDGRAVYLNPAAAGLLALDTERWIGEPILEPLYRVAPGVAAAAAETLDTGKAIRNREVEILRDEERALPYSASTALLEHVGAPPLVTLVLQDLQMARQLEELHLRASRLGVVAELSASLAHEIKNPLASIRSAVEQLVDARADEEDREMLSRLVVREADRLSRLLGEFNDFARVGVAERKQIDLRKVIGDAIAMVQQQPESTDRATFEVDIEPPLDDLWGDPDLVHQTLTNLILNAVQVSDPEEPVTVRVIADSLKPELVPAEVVGGMPVRIRVVDDGPGIAPDDIGRIFDPFYTRRQGGSGMGLAIAHRAVQAHGGALLVSSSPGNGATFVIILPRRDWQEREELERKGWSELVAEIESPDGPGTAGRAGRTTSRSDEVTDRLG
jgi:two-component system sensor histidine kinase PilS (NtrC family)